MDNKKVSERIPGAKLVPPEGMTKTQYKKLLKRQRWEAEKEIYKEQRKAQKKERDNRRRAEIAQLKEKGDSYEHLIKHRPPKARVDQGNTGFGLVLDCSYDDYMQEKEVVSLSGQITRSYSTNRLAPNRAQLTVSGLDKRLKERFNSRISDHTLWKKEWITFSEDSLESVLKNWQWDANQSDVGVASDFSNVCYLSADTDEILSELKPGDVYVIGGIVDKGRHKNLCKGTAEKLGIKTARLPIEEYITLSGRKVLTTAHVVELLLKWNEFKNWKDAFEAVLPQRKIIENEKSDEQINDNTDLQVDESLQNNDDDEKQ